MKILFDLTLGEIENLILSYGEQKYRAKQIYSNLVCGKSISEMTDIPQGLKDKLLIEFCDAPVKIIKKLVSKDKTVKYHLAKHLQVIGRKKI